MGTRLQLLKHALTALWLFSGLQLCLAQGSISGRVTDASGEALIGATAVLQNTTLGSTTDEDGVYVINNVPAGDYLMSVSYVSFQTVQLKVTVGTGVTQVDVQLSTGALNLDNITVTSTRSGRTQREAAMSLTQLSAAQIGRLSASSQADILRVVPGVHAENGGGEVAANVFVRGLPAGGQYKYTPMQIDGMPVEGTFGLTSSAQDVYFRNDLGFTGIEFVRGGAATLFGVGSAAGIINYTSKTGGSSPRTQLQLETADQNRMKIDFNTGGPLGGDNSKVFYNVSGVYRYDEGPVFSGLPSQGYQFRGNIVYRGDNSVLTISGQKIDDRVQFILPYPLTGGERERPIGNDGEIINTLQTQAIADMAFQTPAGQYRSPLRDGVKTNGGYAMVDFAQNFGEGWKLNAKVRSARYDHQFNFFLDGSGIAGASPVEGLETFVRKRSNNNVSNYTVTYADNGQPLAPTDKLYENRFQDRYRPFFDMSSDINLSKKLSTGKAQHHFTLGTFLTRTEAEDLNVTNRYVSDFTNAPRLVNVTYFDTLGRRVNYTSGGISGRGIGYANAKLQSRKAALYLSDEIVFDKLRIDAGIRMESMVGDINREQTATTTMLTDTNSTNALRNVVWGTGNWNRRRITANDWAAAVSASYAVGSRTNVYANFSKGFFFPELRQNVEFTRDSKGNFVQPDPKAEQIIQTEAGVKYASTSFSGTLAVYSATINDRLQTDFIDTPDGLRQVTLAIGQTATIGTEATFAYVPVKSLTIDGAITYQQHEVKDWKIRNASGAVVEDLSGRWLARQPRFMAQAGLSYDNQALYAGVMAKHIGRRYANNNNSIELEANTIVMANAGYRFNVGQQERLDIGLSVYNLTNSAAADEGSPRAGDNQVEGEFFVGRPILPRRVFLRIGFEF